MFERFSDRARRVVVLAQEEARMLNHDYIGTEHLLLGLMHEGEGVAAKALESLGISLDAVRRQVEEIIGQGQQAPSGHIPFSLIREGDGVAAQVLVKLGADLNRVRQQVIRLLHGYQGTEVIGAGSRRGKRARARLLDDALARIDALDRRLAAIERWVGLRPDLDDLAQEIAQVRREKEAAIDRQDFEDRKSTRLNSSHSQISYAVFCL